MGLTVKNAKVERQKREHKKVKADPKKYPTRIHDSILPSNPEAGEKRAQAPAKEDPRFLGLAESTVG
jgi:hypothetical protein